MTTDRELLELAAKAAGATWIDDNWPEDLPGLMLDFGKGTTQWNPLDDDGDALRLAVKLEMEIYHAFDDVMNVYASYPVEEGQIQGIQYVVEPHNKDPFATTRDPLAATRRAIVRAAAEIGRNMI
jgi:hypothetical protein